MSVESIRRMMQRDLPVADRGLVRGAVALDCALWCSCSLHSRAHAIGIANLRLD